MADFNLKEDVKLDKGSLIERSHFNHPQKLTSQI